MEKLIQTQLESRSGTIKDDPDKFPTCANWQPNMGSRLNKLEKKFKRGLLSLRQQSTDVTERARAEFCPTFRRSRADFFDEAATAKLARTRELTANAHQLKNEAVADLAWAGEAFNAQGNYNEALNRFSTALTYSNREIDSQRWALLQTWIPQ